MLGKRTRYVPGMYAEEKLSKTSGVEEARREVWKTLEEFKAAMGRREERKGDKGIVREVLRCGGVGYSRGRTFSESS
jgi:hypothetical protein